LKLLVEEGVDATDEALDLLAMHVRESGAKILDKVINYCIQNEIALLKHHHLSFLGNKTMRKRTRDTQDEE
jgi:hypothetical protein